MSDTETMSKPTVHAGGRPTKYYPEVCNLVVEWGKLGKSRAWIASELEVCKRTLVVWEEAHPEFLSAMTRAMAHSQRWWEDKGQNSLDTREFQASVWSRSMSARFPDDWRETSRQEQTGPNGGPIQVNKVERVIVDPHNQDA